MNVVELLERLRAAGVELAGFDMAGPVWTPNGRLVPDEAKPWVQYLVVELHGAVRGMSTGHRWGVCSKCNQAQRVSKKNQTARKCHMTPYCKGVMERWIDLPAVKKESMTTTRTSV